MAKKKTKGRTGVYDCRGCPLDDMASDDVDDGTLNENDKEGCPRVNEEHEELHDAHSPIYDQLKERWAWWILEFMPLSHRVQHSDGTNMKVIS